MQVLRNQLASPKLKTLTADEFHNMFVDLLKEIKVLTGAIIHGNEAKKDQLAQLNGLKLFVGTSHKFMNLTVKELRQAFYLNNQGELDEIYKHYNKPLNAEFMGSVLSAFLRYKAKFSDTIPEVLYLLRPKQEVPKVTDEMLRHMIQQDYELYRAGQYDNIFNASLKYLYLRRIKALQLTSRKKWWDWYWRAVEYRINRLKQKAATKAENQQRNILLEAYDKFLEEHLIDRAEHRLIVHLARRLMYFRFFDLLAGAAITHVFEDVSYDRYYTDYEISRPTVYLNYKFRSYE